MIDNWNLDRVIGFGGKTNARKTAVHDHVHDHVCVHDPRPRLCFTRTLSWSCCVIVNVIVNELPDREIWFF
jgi:hypothetical protein